MRDLGISAPEGNQRRGTGIENIGPAAAAAGELTEGAQADGVRSLVSPCRELLIPVFEAPNAGRDGATPEPTVKAPELAKPEASLCWGLGLSWPNSAPSSLF